MSKRNKKQRGPLTPKKAREPMAMFGFAEGVQLKPFPDFKKCICVCTQVEADDIRPLAELGISANKGQFIVSKPSTQEAVGPFESAEKAYIFAQQNWGVARWFSAPTKIPSSSEPPAPVDSPAPIEILGFTGSEEDALPDIATRICMVADIDCEEVREHLAMKWGVVGEVGQFVVGKKGKTNADHQYFGPFDDPEVAKKYAMENWGVTRWIRNPIEI